jgi:hypothetical protein
MTQALHFQSRPMSDPVQVEVVALAGREAGSQSVALLAPGFPRQDDRPEPELWVGEKSRRHVIYYHPMLTTRDYRWSAGPPSPHEASERLIFLGCLTDSIPCDARDWFEMARTRITLAHAIELRGTVMEKT